MEVSDPEKQPDLSHPHRRISSTPSSSSSTPSSPASTCSDHPQTIGKETETSPLTPTTSQLSRPEPTRQLTHTTSLGQAFTQDPSFEVDFGENDPEDPRNWSIWYKSFTIFTISFGTLVVVLYSTSYTAAITTMQAEFHVSSEPIATLGVTTYLFGLAIGSLFLAPISETYGRKPVYTISMVCFVLLVIPAAMAKSMASIIIVRFFGALAGSAMVANAPGTIGDIVSDEWRATAFSVWSIGPMNGPVLGPVIGGFVTQYASWRWANWVVLIAGSLACILLFLIRETYAPALLQRRTKTLRKSTSSPQYWCRYDVRVPFPTLMKINLSRPFIMAVTEPICIFWNLYIAVVYGILYLCFVAYPIVFTETRGWALGDSGLAFVGIGLGTMLTIVLAPVFRRWINSHKPGPDGQIPPESMMSVVCLAACLIPLGELWFAWTCLPVSIHPAASIAAGIPFGMGNAAVFIYASNYLVHSYGIYAASAMAGNAVIRSFLGGTLPLAGPTMYRTMGANWASTLLGLLEVAIIPIPFVFLRYGSRIREKSALIRAMREDQERQDIKRRRAKEVLERAVREGDEKGVKVARGILTRVNTRTDGEEERAVAAGVQLARVEGLRVEQGEKDGAGLDIV